MKHLFRTALAAAALCAAATLPASAEGLELDSLIKLAREVFKEADAGKSADAVSRIVGASIENADDAVANVGDVASALSAAVVAKDGNDTAEALAGIVGAAAKTDDAVALASRAAAVVKAVSDVPDVADAIAKALDGDLAAAVKDASLSAEDAQKEEDQLLLDIPDILAFEAEIAGRH